MGSTGGLKHLAAKAKVLRVRAAICFCVVALMINDIQVQGSDATMFFIAILSLVKVISEVALISLVDLLCFYFHSLGPLLLPPKITQAAWLIELKV